MTKTSLEKIVFQNLEEDKEEKSKPVDIEVRFIAVGEAGVRIF